jgi:putative redox protein
MKLIVESAGAVASRVKFGAHELVFDQPPAVPGGEDRGPSPLDVMAASVGACAHYFAAAFLHARRLSVEGLRVEVEAEKAREPRPRWGRISMRVILPASVPEQYLSPIERAVRNCPAYGTLVDPPELELTIGREAHSPAA